MKRRLAVPVALSSGFVSGSNAVRSRRLRIEDDTDDLILLTKISANRGRIERLKEDIETDPTFEACDEEKEDLDFLRASLQLEFLEITGDLEESRSSEELFEEALV